MGVVRALQNIDPKRINPDLTTSESPAHLLEAAPDKKAAFAGGFFLSGRAGSAVAVQRAECPVSLTSTFCPASSLA